MSAISHVAERITEGRLLAHLRSMLARTEIVPIHDLQGELSVGCVDGRQTACVASAPGGNAGLFILLLSTLESESGDELAATKVAALFRSYLDHFGTFYLHTDRHAMDRLAATLGVDPAGVEELVRRPPAGLRERLAAEIAAPAHVGCGHLREMLLRPAAYDVRPGLVEAVLQVFFEALWDRDPRLTFDVLGGDHHECAVARVRVESREEGRPLLTVCPHHGDLELFVHHPDAVGYLEAAHAVFLIARGMLAPESASSFIAAQNDRSERQLATTLESLAPGLPVFDVLVVPRAGARPDIRVHPARLPNPLEHQPTQVADVFVP
jgi:hypothetical protein